MFDCTIRKSVLNRNLIVDITNNDRELEIKDCKAFLGLFSISSRSTTVPLRNVASCNIVSRISKTRIIEVVVMFIISLLIAMNVDITSFTSDLFTFISLVLCPIALILSIIFKEHVIEITDTGSRAHAIGITFQDKEKAFNVVKQINDSIGSLEK